MNSISELPVASKSSKSSLESMLVGVRAAAAAGMTPVIVAIPSATMRPKLLVPLLEREGVTGLLLSPKVARAFSGDDRIGQFGDLEFEWKLPNVRVRALVLVGGVGMLGVRWAWRALRRGIRTVFYVDSLGIWQSVWLPRFVLSRGTRRLAGLILCRLNVEVLFQAVALTDFVVVRRLGRWLRCRRALPPETFVPGRILLVNESLAPGGAERQLVNTANGLAARGLDVSILCRADTSYDSHGFYGPMLDSRIEVINLDALPECITGREHGAALETARKRLSRCGLGGNIPGLPLWVRDDVLAFAVEFAIRKPEVVHLWQDYTNVVAGLAASFVGVPRIAVGMRNMAPFHFPYIQPFMRAAYRVLAGQPNVVLVNNSRAGAADYAAWLGVPEERFDVIRNGIDEAAMQRPKVEEVRTSRQRLGLPDGAPVVGSVFRFYPEKQPQLWVKTAAEIARRRRDVVFLLVGWGPMQDEIVAYATKAGIMDRLFMPGPQKDVRSVVSCMDVFLLTSRIEGTPNVLLEAQMMGVPVVTTNAGGSAETLEHGKTGWVVPNHKPDRLADRVLAILDDREWSVAARELGPSLVSDRFGFERMIDDTLQSYKLDAHEPR